MAPKKRKVVNAVKPAVRLARTKHPVRATRRVAARLRPARKIFNDASLFGALPGMGDWALPLLKELRDE